MPGSWTALLVPLLLVLLEEAIVVLAGIVLYLAFNRAFQNEARFLAASFAALVTAAVGPWVVLWVQWVLQSLGARGKVTGEAVAIFGPLAIALVASIISAVKERKYRVMALCMALASLLSFLTVWNSLQQILAYFA